MRKCHALRAHIDKMLAEGWRITGRDPVRLERGNDYRLVQMNGVVKRALGAKR